MSKYDFEITDAGLRAAADALEKGYKIRIVGVEIGDAIISVSQVPAMTRPAGNVTWKSEDNPEVETLFYQKVVDNGVQFKVELPNTIGNFLIGNVCLKMDDEAGTIFAVGCLPQQLQKIKKSNDTTGNAFNFYLGTALDHSYEAIDVTLLPKDPAQSLPIASTEEDLPDYSSTWFNVWEIENYKNTGYSALAVRGTHGWLYYTANNGSIVPGGSGIAFGPNVNEGDVVYYNPTTNTFDLADGTDSSKGALGIRNGDNVVYTGSYLFPAGTLVPGQKYYAGQNGTLTTTPNAYYLGTAITDSCLLLGIEWSPQASTTVVGTARFATNAEVLAKTQTNTMVSPKTLGDNYPQKAKTDTVSGNWTFSGNNGFSGTNTFTGNTTIANATFNGSTYTAGGNWTFSNAITGPYFNGIAYKAKWADLAELYEADKDYPVGTLLKFGGDYEVTIADNEVNCVKSSNPGFILNHDCLNNPCEVALVGKVPVRVIGKVNKFDKLVLSNIPGVATKQSDNSQNIIGIALESSDSVDEKLINCVVILRM